MINNRLEHAVARARELAKSPLFHVYFVQCEGFVKIGYAQNILDRVSHYIVHNPFKVSLLASFSTRRPQADENLLHTAFEAYRVRGEWFRLPDRVVKWIKDNKDSINVESLLVQAVT